jgi:hypothetical protein
LTPHEDYSVEGIIEETRKNGHDLGNVNQVVLVLHHPRLNQLLAKFTGQPESPQAPEFAQAVRVIGALGDDLENALDVTIIYLRAGIRIADAKKLVDHLDHAPEKLLAYYKEFKVCDGLYGLRDEFKQVFNAKR